MKKIAFVLSLLFVGGAVADSAPTSVGYVDNAIGALQNKISAVDTNTVLTHTNTAGEIGQKSIYDATGNYASQTNALVTAEVANAAVQNAIDTEFVCIEWLDGAEHTNDNCLIYDVRAITPKSSSKNLLDPSFMDNSTYGPITVNGYNFIAAKVLPTENGKTYTLSATINSTGYFYYYLAEVLQDGTVRSGGDGWCPHMWFRQDGAIQSQPCTFTARDNATYTVYFAGGSKAFVDGAKANLTLSEYQMEEGSVATEYEPYQNLYLPSGN